METTIQEATRVFLTLAGSELSTRKVGLYLRPDAYKLITEHEPAELADLVGSAADDDDLLAWLTEAALAADDVHLFHALYEQVGYERFLSVFADYFGLSSFFVYSAVTCLSYYLDAQLEDPAAWSEMCEEYLFDEYEEDLWEKDWSPSWRRHGLAVLYLLHFKGGISATSLLKKCILHRFSAFYHPLVAIGARFEVEDLYLADFSLSDLRTLLYDGLLDTLKVSARPEDWVYLTQKFVDLTGSDDEELTTDDEA